VSATIVDELKVVEIDELYDEGEARRSRGDDLSA